MIPKNWKLVKIGEISIVKRGASPRPINDPSYFSNEGRGWIRISDVTTTYKYLKKTSQYLSKKGEERSVAVNPGDLIMSICATIGKPIILDIEACIHDGFVLFSNFSKEADVEYLFYVLQKNEAMFSSKRQTGTQGNLNTNLVGNTVILLPPFPEQKKIAEVLSTVDQAIEKVGEAIEKTQRVKKGLMQELLTKGIGHKEFKETEIGKMPKEWEVIRLDQACQQRNELIQPKEITKENFIGLEDIKSGEMRAQSFRSDSEIKSCKFKFCRGDILYGKLRPYLDKAIIADLDGICSTDLLVLSTNKNEIKAEFLIYIIHSKDFIDFAVSNTTGTNHPRTSWKAISKYEIGKPHLKEQQKIAEILSTMDKRLESLRIRKERLKKVKKGLMEDLLTGKVRVTKLIEKEA